MALPKLDLSPFLSSSSSSSSLSSLSSPTASSESRTPVESEATELVHRQAEPSDTDPPLPIPGPRAMIRTTQITQASVANQDSSGTMPATTSSSRPYLGHTEWQRSHARLQALDSGFRSVSLPPDADRPSRANADRVPQRSKSHKSRSDRHHSRRSSRQMKISRDFFLIIILCLVLACALICFVRPIIFDWYTDGVLLETF